MSYFNGQDIKDIIKRALEEDIGGKDVTTSTIIPNAKFVRAILLAKESCVICGLGIAREVFKVQDKRIKFKALICDGQKIKKGKVIVNISGSAQSILTAERVALNFLSLLSGVATRTKEYADKVKPYKVKILDTRKTVPLLRELQKYAIRAGGGYNHRMKLDEMILIKDNHLKVIGGYGRLPEIAGGYQCEIEVKNLNEFKGILKFKPDIIMLDNMSIKDMKKAVRIRNSLPVKIYGTLPKLEASGGITLENVKKVAACGVDLISIGELTHSVKSADISLEIV